MPMINFTGSPGTLFSVLGKCGNLIKQLLVYQLAQKTNMIGSNELDSQLSTQPDIQALVGQNYLSQLSIPESIANSLATQIAAQFANRVVYLDNPQPGQTLTSLNTLASLLEIIRQMKAESATILAMTIGSTTNLFASNNSNVGDGVFILSTRRPLDGKVLENSFAETLTVLCTQDSYLGGATPFNEGFTITGQASEPDPFAYDWPLGSNCSVAVNAIDGDTNNGSGNLLNNSGFATWAGTPSLPSNWTFNSGSSLVTKETGLVFGSGNALKITGDGSTLVSFQQQFGASTGSSSTLASLNQYGVNLWIRRGGSAVTGQLNIELVDQNGTITTDYGGNLNQFTIDLSGTTPFYAAFNGVFRTTLISPNQYWIRLRTPPGQALSNGGVVYLAKLSMGSMSQLYTGGPFSCVFSGSVPFIQGDFATGTITNSRGSGGTLSTFQTLLWQLFSDVQQSELIFPSSATPTISDSLIGP